MTLIGGIYVYVVTWVLLGGNSSDNLSFDQWKEFMVRKTFFDTFKFSLYVIFFACSIWMILTDEAKGAPRTFVVLANVWN